jgi:uncharacterized protein YdeI (YjbR/CyaY-like superfamily)
MLLHASFDFPLASSARMKAQLKSVKKSFKAKLEQIPSPKLGWTIIGIPLDVPKIWGARGMLRVKGELNGFPFRTTLFPTRKGHHFLLVNKKMQAGAHVRAGDTAHFQIEPDLAKREAIVPPELKRALSEDRAVLRWFGTLTYSIRKWLCDWIAQPKSPASRERRAQQVAEQLFSTMEAEKELPPILKAAFTRDPRGLQGWQMMSPVQRRNQLLAIFYYRNPESRQRRADKAIQAAISRAERKTGTADEL